MMGDTHPPAPKTAETPAGRYQGFYHRRGERQRTQRRAETEAKFAAVMPRDVLIGAGVQKLIDQVHVLGMNLDALGRALAPQKRRVPHADLRLSDWRPDEATIRSLLIGAYLCSASSDAETVRLLRREQLWHINRYHLRRRLTAFSRLDLDRNAQGDSNIVACRQAVYDWLLARHCWQNAKRYYQPSSFARDRWRELQESGLLFSWREGFDAGHHIVVPAAAVDALLARAQAAASPTAPRSHLKLVK